MVQRGSLPSDGEFPQHRQLLRSTSSKLKLTVGPAFLFHLPKPWTETRKGKPFWKNKAPVWREGAASETRSVWGGGCNCHLIRKEWGGGSSG